MKIIMVISASVIVIIALLLIFKKKLLNIFGRKPKAESQTVTQASNKEFGGKNNPGYLIWVKSIAWQGKEDNNPKKFENFTSLSYGARAWFRNLKTHIDRGSIYDEVSLIDVLTPAGSENSETARNNYKAYISGYWNNKRELGRKVFEFENNPDYTKASQSQKEACLDTYAEFF